MLEVQFHDHIDAIAATDWDALGGADNPFASHAFLALMERHQAIRPQWGWRPRHLGLYRNRQLVAAAPLYLKDNSRGEFVFDWGWAHAWENAGGRYYPKLLNASPWSPITGPRLLTGNHQQSAAWRQQLVHAMQTECLQHGLSSVHANFLAPQDAAAFGPDWLKRQDLQFHWHNAGYQDFSDFLSTLRHRKRKNIRQERKQAAGNGLQCGMVSGADLGQRDWQRVHALYQSTFARKGNFGVLSADCLQAMANHPALDLRLALARDQGDIVAMALFFASRDTLYGRYWGATRHFPGLHFELCYYRGIDYCIEHGLSRFEPGAQGEHKMARGFVPQRTESRHYIANPSFRAAIAEALDHEAHAIEHYHADLQSHSPYHQQASPETSP